jgi:hypothetical protein
MLEPNLLAHQRALLHADLVGQIRHHTDQLVTQPDLPPQATKLTPRRGNGIQLVGTPRGPRPGGFSENAQPNGSRSLLKGLPGPKKAVTPSPGELGS